MIIKRLFITGYKNLIDCDFSPKRVCAITGCNGSGKSNILEVLPFVVGLIAGSDEHRQSVLNKGRCPIGLWFPLLIPKGKITPFRFVLESLLEVNGTMHLVEYTLEIDPVEIKDGPIYLWEGSRIKSEKIRTKKVGSSGAMKTILIRNAESTVVVHGGKSLRAKKRFKCKQDMSALQAFEVREADAFKTNFPIFATFLRSFLATELVRLDARTFRRLLYNPNREPVPQKLPGMVIDAYDPYPFLCEIRENKPLWEDFQRWLKRLVDLDSLELFEPEPESKNAEQTQVKKTQHIFAKQYGRPLAAGVLSMGSNVGISYLIILFALVKNGGAALFEEPENYLHPKAIVELIELFREFSSDHTVIFSTHSPVALNSMDPDEVCVMTPIGNGFVTIKTVSKIEEAVSALSRGFVNFGDLLQIDYGRK